MTDAVTKLSFTEIQMVRTRNVMVYKFEGPLETADEALNVLGGVPQPGTERWVAIARLVADTESSPPDEPTAKPSSHDEPRSEGEKAWIRSIRRAKDPKFQEWISIDNLGNVRNEYAAAAYIKRWCNIQSRRELATNPDALAKYQILETTFRVWRDYPNQQTSARPPVPERPPA